MKPQRQVPVRDVDRRAGNILFVEEYSDRPNEVVLCIQSFELDVMVMRVDKYKLLDSIEPLR